MPYLGRAMASLQVAGMSAATPTDVRTQGTDAVKAIQLLRKALVEAFMSIINGIKSPGNENQNNMNSSIIFNQTTFEHI